MGNKNSRVFEDPQNKERGFPEKLLYKGKITVLSDCSRHNFEISMTGKSLKVWKEGAQVEEINLEYGFEVISEQEEDLIFSVCYVSSDLSTKTLKIQTKDFSYLLPLLKEATRPHWQHSQNCEVCSRQFGIICRRHHCRKCGASICSHCSAAFTTLPELGLYSLQRICTACNSYISAKRSGKQGVNSKNYIIIK